MKVWVLYQDWGAYEGCSAPEAVFSTELAARRAMAEKHWAQDRRVIAELEVDAMPAEAV